MSGVVLSRVGLGMQMRVAYEAVSPLIEEYTSSVCPDCVKVCCIDRHGTHEEADILFLNLIGSDIGSDKIPPEPQLDDDKRPCRHLGTRGCDMERWQRPYRCTWYFCEPLLEHMQKGGSRKYRRMIEALERLGGLRARLMELSA